MGPADEIKLFSFKKHKIHLDNRKYENSKAIV